MPVIETMLDSRDAVFVANRSALETLVADLKSKVRAIEQGGGDVARGRHTGRGKLLPRDRVATLLDPGSPFLELSQLAAYGMYDDNIAAAGIITGVGRVNGIGLPCHGPGLCDQTTKFVWAFFGLAPATLFVTGAIMWWNRVVRKKPRRTVPQK